MNVSQLGYNARVGLPGTPEQQAAMKRLTKAGLEFGVHFGVENAVLIGKLMDIAIQQGRGYRWFREIGVNE